MAKIVMWGLTTLATEEQKNQLKKLEKKHTALSLQFENKDPSLLSDCIVLLKHDTDIPDNTNLNSVQWTVICSGRVTESKINEANKTAGIPPTILIENLGDFLSATKSKAVFDKQDIEILFAIDPKLEKLLEPFAAFNPFNGTDLILEKENLQKRVNELLKKS